MGPMGNKDDESELLTWKGVYWSLLFLISPDCLARAAR